MSSSSNSYGSKLVSFMLSKEKAFTPFRSCYYLLYQCLVPNPREGLSLLVQHCSVPDDFERSILSGGIPRLCNQGILNYLLIILRRDKDFVKFWNIMKLLIDKPELRIVVERIQKGIFQQPKTSIHLQQHPISNRVESEDVFPLEERAPSLVEYEDDCCISYTVTIVDVRSCTRCTRVPVDQERHQRFNSNEEDLTRISSLPLAQQMLIANNFTELQSHYSVLVRSMPDDYMNTVSQLERHLTGDHIGSILECVSVFTANQRILDCLIEQLNDKEDVLLLCKRLSVINNAPSLTVVIKDLEKDIISALKSGDNPAGNGGSVDTSLSPNDLSNSTSAVVPVDRRLRDEEPEIFSKLQSGQLGPKGVAVLKKHYYNLLKNLSENYMVTMEKLCQSGVVQNSDQTVDAILSWPDAEFANRKILDFLIGCIKSDQDLLTFCDRMEDLVNIEAVVHAVRDDCLQNVIQVDTQVTFNSPNHNPSDVLSSNTTTNMIAAATISAATTSTSTITSATVTTSSAVLSSATMSSSTSPVQPVSSENYCLQNVIQVETQVTLNSPNHNPCDVLSSNTTTNMIAAAAISAATTSTSTITSTTVTTSSFVPSSTTMSSSTSSVLTTQDAPTENYTGREYDVLLSSYFKLTQLLPVDSLLHNFVTARIIDLNDTEEIMSLTTTRKKAIYLLHKIAAPLEAGYTEKFYQLLTIMEEYGGDLAKLADEIRTSLNEFTGNQTVPVTSSSAHQKRLQYQAPPSLPASYITRTKLQNEIITAILTSDVTPTIGTTVTIRGIGGTGKSTLAKAVCHDPMMKKNFPDGFLWISLTPPVGSPASMLKNLYTTLTNEQIDGDASFILNKLKSLPVLHPSKHLIILDDVWGVDDVMMFADLFSNYKVILTTRKMDINTRIPPKHCFDIQKMDINEAIQLLLLNVTEIEKLSPSNYNAVSELANNLYCWPLLLNLVHGQLYVHCVEWGESPTNAISTVQQKLFDKGMTAFDSEKDNREEAVKASITLSLDLLQEDEETLLYHAISSLGIGTSVCKQMLLNKSHMNTEQFNKCTIALWSHGLVTFSRVNVLNLGSCVEVHEVIAQYILDEMPYNFCKIINIHDMQNQTKLFHINIDDIKTSQDYISFVDDHFIPHIINELAVITRASQMGFMQKLNMLIETHPKLLETNTMMKFFNEPQPLPIKKVYKNIKDNCKIIQTLLANDRHDEAITWFSNHYDTHPVVTTFTKIIDFYNSLQKECSNDPELVVEINKQNNNSEYDINKFKVLVNSLIMQRAQVVSMISSGVPDDDIVKYIMKPWP